MKTLSPSVAFLVLTTSVLRIFCPLPILVAGIRPNQEDQDCQSAWPTSAPDTSSRLFRPPTAISSHGAAPTATRDRSWRYGAAKSVDIADAIHATMSRVRQLARRLRVKGRVYCRGRILRRIAKQQG
ncbi:hypothetical protein MAP00_004508 [Monascus purpureus]|nr:hypothetical protein MAP00_004508 [Monascus purpureus]